jgi:hypothetical protein
VGFESDPRIVEAGMIMDFLISPNFLLGLFGALVTLYLAKQVVIPELRPLYDTTDMEVESKSLRALTDDARQRIAAVLNQLATETRRSADLSRQLDGLQTSLNSNQKRLDVLEGRLLRSQMMSRGLGFLLFVILGGVVAYLLTGRVTVTGFQGTLPQGFQAIAIGAGWTGFLSVFGIRNIQESATKQVDAVKDGTVQQLNDLKASLDGLVRPGPGAVQGPIMVPFSAQAGLSKEISERIDNTLREVSARFNAAKVRISEDSRRVV